MGVSTQSTWGRSSSEIMSATQINYGWTLNLGVTLVTSTDGKPVGRYSFALSPATDSSLTILHGVVPPAGSIFGRSVLARVTRGVWDLIEPEEDYTAEEVEVPVLKFEETCPTLAGIFDAMDEDTDLLLFSTEGDPTACLELAYLLAKVYKLPERKVAKKVLLAWASQQAD